MSSEALSSSEASSPEAERLKNFKCCSNDDLIAPIIAED